MLHPSLSEISLQSEMVRFSVSHTVRCLSTTALPYAGREQKDSTILHEVDDQNREQQMVLLSGPYLAFKQDHWADKPASAPGHLASVNEVLQLVHLHRALKPSTDRRMRSARQ